MTFLCLYISRWWRQTWDTAPYLTVVNQSEARISTEHGIKLSIPVSVTLDKLCFVTYAQIHSVFYCVCGVLSCVFFKYISWLLGRILSQFSWMILVKLIGMEEKWNKTIRQLPSWSSMRIIETVRNTATFRVEALPVGRTFWINNFGICYGNCVTRLLQLAKS